MNHERALRVLALRDVLYADSLEFLVREKIRWYAREYHVSPHVVERDVPLDDVLRHYWESHYSDLKAAAEGGDGAATRALQAERELLSLTEAEAEEARRAEDAADAEIARYARAQKEVEPAPPPPPVTLPEDVDLEFPDLDQDPLGGSGLFRQS